jgi:hypothetical protein
MTNILDLYSDYLLCSTQQTTATGLSTLVDGSLSHDKITRFLTSETFDSKLLWTKVKPLVREFENSEGCLIFDDTVIEKAHMDENDMISWHWDHSKSRNIKGINLLTGFYVSSKPSSDEFIHVPVAYELIKKDVRFCEIQTKKEKRKSAVTKNELMRLMIKQQIRNSLKFKYVLADSWFCSNENMRFTARQKKNFIFDVKTNRLAAKNELERNKGRFQRIDQLEIADNIPVKVWLKDLEIQVLLIKQVFTNKDQSIGVRFLVSNDLTLTDDQFGTLYKKRWSVEEFHKSIKQNTSVAKSPARSVKAQSNHLFASIYAFVKLEKIRVTQSFGHFAIKTKIYMASLKAAFKELNNIKLQFKGA